MYLPTVRPGEQVVVIPDWVFKTLAKKGKIEDLVNFSLMRQWFNQEQLVAIDRFSQNGLSVLWGNSFELPEYKARPEHEVSSRSLGYIWYFPEEAGQSKNGSAADDYAKGQMSDLANNHAYANKMVSEHILDYLRQPAANKIDIHQSYSVYSGSDKLIVVSLNQGTLDQVIYNRKQELRFAILQSIVAKLQEYYALNIVHKTDWFGRYLTELSFLQ